MTDSDRLILNVEDQEAIRYAKTRALLRGGFKVLEATSGSEGLECVEAFGPVLVICDVKLPDMSGLEVCRIIKEKHPFIAVLQTSATFVTAQDRATGLDGGANSYLTEPIDPEELLATVRALLRLKTAENELRRERDQRDFIIALSKRHRALETPEAIVRTTIEALGQWLKARSVDFYQVLADGAVGLHRTWSAEGEPSAPQRSPENPDEALRGRFRAGETVVAHSADEEHGARRPELEQGDQSASIRAPMLRGERWRATLCVFDHAPRTWTHGEVSLVEEVAELTFDAIERSQATLDLQKLNDSLAGLVAERTKELQQSEAQLRQSQKMEAIGQLTGGIAHDFNNLLTGIIGGINLVRRRIDRGDLNDVGRIMDAVEASSSRAASLTQRMLAFSRLQPLDFRAVDVNELIQTVGDVLSRSIGENIKLTVDAQDGLWSADTDPSQLETAILNLVINARDAMPDGGQVILKTANRTIEDQTDRSSELNPGDYVMLSVADTGAGMSSDTLGRVFEPFFTTKPIGQGTGLGLSMVYGFVKQSRGHVVVESELGRGTVVSLYLPRHDGRQNEPEIPASDVAPGARDGEVILLAEDDPSIRLLVTDHLSELGYRVIAVSDGNEAFRQLNTDTRIDLLLTDIGLPGPSGRDVAARARLKRENLAILFVTGYESGVARRTALVGRRIDLIAKPFDLDRLAMRVRTLLNS